MFTMHRLLQLTVPVWLKNVEQLERWKEQFIMILWQMFPIGEYEKRVMETRKMKLGADHPDTLTSMNNLASTYMAQWRWEDSMACPDFRRSSCHRKIPLDLSIATVDVCQ
ncbi:uncharacterized protein N7473_000337, partial [Penicillium subrubescens]|uniref:uncharacterized protein n=1 Tax=Penicillium subrubescens TaxID=1316194 RepID=UPI00254500B4